MVDALGVEGGQKIREVVFGIYVPESAAHDFYHLDRVASLAVRVAWGEKVDSDQLQVVVAASYLHDLHRHLENSTGRYHSAKNCDQWALELMVKADIPNAIHEIILDAIHYTEHYSFGKTHMWPEFKTSSIVRDADNLDAMGAIGIARAFTYGGRISEPIWTGEDHNEIGCYESGVPAKSVVRHFYEKLLKLMGELETDTGRKIGEQRHHYMQNFLKQLMMEWKNES